MDLAMLSGSGRIGSMKADWDDAPLRMRSGQKYRAMRCGSLLALGPHASRGGARLILRAAVTRRAPARAARPANLISTPAAPDSLTERRPASSAHDPYLGAVNRMLGITGNHASEPIAHLE